MASMTLDFPEPLGPTIEEKDCGVSGRAGRASVCLMEGSDFLPASVRLEILKDNLVHDEPACVRRVRRGRDGRRRGDGGEHRARQGNKKDLLGRWVKVHK